MKKNYNLFLTFLVMFLVQLSFGQQEKDITGTVTAASDGLPLPGVTVLVKGTTTGTSTDIDGKYSISAKTGDVLVFSFVSMKTTERAVGSSNTIDLAMEDDTAVLDEVVVIGYGTQSRRKLTDNIVSVSAKDIEGVPTPSVFNTLAGKLTGVQVTQQNGKVEGGLNFRVRGLGSFAGNQPLFVLDGVILINNDLSSNGAASNPLITLGPNEIESIDVLKDAAATAIYGSRGGNGVVIITTKSGREGKAKFSVNLSNGFSDPANKRDWLNAAEYIELFTEAAQRSPFGDLSGPGSFLEGNFESFANGTDFRNGEVDTDWQDLAFQDGHTRDVDFSVSGGNEKTSYFFSGSYNDTAGIIRGNFLERITARTNLSHQVTDKLKMGMNVSYARVENDRIANDNAFVTPLQAIAQVPISPAFNDDGTANANTLYANHLLQEQNSFFKTHIRRVTGKVDAEYQFIPSLKFTSRFSYDFLNQTEDNFTGRLAPFQSTDGQAFASNANIEDYTYSNYLTFDKTFSEAHNLNVVGGIELQRSDTRTTSVTGTNFPTDDFQTVNSAAMITAGTGFETSFGFFGYFLRATYDYKGKYLFKGSIRRDGSSRFGSDRRFGTFPALSAGWVLSEEEFLNDNSIINFLKLRASWGQIGNAEIGNFASRGLFAGTSFNSLPGIRPSQAGNNNLTWEQVENIDIGIEFGLFNNRLSGDIAYYVQDNSDGIFGVPISLSAGGGGINAPNVNIGEIETKGIEASLRGSIIQNENFSWSASFNIAQVDNEVIGIPEGQDIIAGQNILREGETRNAFFIIEYAGVDPANGDALYIRNTTNPDGSIDRSTTNDPNEAERVVTGNPFAEWIGGLSSNIAYKNWDFSFTFQGEWGADIFNGGGRFQSANADFFDNQSADQLNRWQNPGDITDVPEARLFGANGTAQSTRYLQDGDFIRLRNITLGYTLPSSVTDRLGLSSLRIYASAFNLLTITDFDGYDPESRSDAGGIGQVFYSAPAARTISIGANINF